MKFLCDIHISYKIVKHLISLGFDAIHVSDILNKSETKDSAICEYADINDYVVITKDSDFRNSFLVNQTPKKLIKINLGSAEKVCRMPDLRRQDVDVLAYFKSQATKKMVCDL